MCKGSVGAIPEQSGRLRQQVDQQAGRPVSATVLARAAESSAPPAAAHAGSMTAAAGCLCTEPTASKDEHTLCTMQ